MRGMLRFRRLLCVATAALLVLVPVSAVQANLHAPRTNAPRSSAPGSNAPRTNAPRSSAPGSNAPRSNAARRNAHRTKAPPTRVIRYHGYRLVVPAAWPVYDLATNPTVCVRFNRHAVYLGRPSTRQRCPAHAAGRTEAILVAPMAAHAAGARGTTGGEALPPVHGPNAQPKQ